jgi:hypothetical protein
MEDRIPPSLRGSDDDFVTSRGIPTSALGVEHV